MNRHIARDAAGHSKDMLVRLDTDRDHHGVHLEAYLGNEQLKAFNSLPYLIV